MSHFVIQTGGDPGDGSTRKFASLMLDSKWNKGTLVKHEFNGGFTMCGAGFVVHFYTTDEAAFRQTFEAILANNPHVAYYGKNLVKSAEPWKPEPKPKPTRAVTRSMTRDAMW
jgi:hypothetical protein